MNADLDKVGLASIPSNRLDVLAVLRRDPGITVSVRGDRAWVAWDPGRVPVARRLLPVEGVALYHLRDGRAYRFGAWLPSPDVPGDLGPTAVALVRALVPGPAAIHDASAIRIRPTTLGLARDDSPRPTAALICSLADLGAWADRATRTEIESVQAALTDDLAVLVGDRLPFPPRARRFWGTRVLVPLGWRCEPDLRESALAGVFGLGEHDRAIIHEGGAVEVLPGDVLRPLTRGAVRLALRGRPS